MAVDDDLFLVVFLLAVIYGSVFAFAIFRTSKLRRFGPEWTHTKFFYIWILLWAFIRTVSFLTFMGVSGFGGYSQYLIVSIPEALFVPTFILLFWLMATVFYYSHALNDMNVSLMGAQASKANVHKAALTAMLLIMLWCVLVGVLYIALWVSKFTESDFSRMQSVVNIILSFVAIVSMIYMACKFSGRPYKSLSWKHKLIHVNGALGFWSITRLIIGIIGLFTDYSQEAVSGYFESYDPHTDAIPMMVTIINLIISEILCMLVVLDYGFIAIFIFTQQEIASEGARKESETVDIEEKLNEGEEDFEASSYKRSTMELGDTVINQKKISILEELDQSNFGTVYKANYGNLLCVVRKLNFTRVSRYVLEDLNFEVENLRHLDCPFLVPILGVYIDLPEIGIIMPYMPNGSLFQLLHIKEYKFKSREKIRISKELAYGMNRLSKAERYHGHLSANNILLDDRMRVFIADIGLYKFKKYAGIVNSYSNRNIWSSPEILREKNPIPAVSSQQDDVFSYGTILWELFTEQIPFEGYDLKQVAQMVGVENYRLGLGEECPNNIAQIIMSCWNTDPTKRPSFELICQTLKDIDQTIN